MDWPTLLGIAIALAMDAFAVALGAGLTVDPVTGRHLFRLGFHFGLFQAMMPVIGWLAGIRLQRWIADYDHWVALALLGLIGGRMIAGALRKDDGERPVASDPTRGWSLVMLSVATSVDALAVGLSLAMLGVSIWVPAAVIGVICGALTVIGMLCGRRIGAAWGGRVEIGGGLVLIAIGIKIVIEHTV